MLESKKRAELRALANGLNVVVTVGKEGVTEGVCLSADKALTARELIKGRVLNTCMESAAECANALADKLSAEVVQVIGTRFVLYRYNPELHKPKPPAVVVPNNRFKTGTGDKKKLRVQSGFSRSGRSQGRRPDGFPTGGTKR